jgi:hypothetical protein
MKKRVAMIAGLGLLATISTSPVLARGAVVERIGPFETVLAVRMDDDFPIASLMRANCSSLIRIERPDGSSIEIQNCQLSDSPVMIPEFQGVAPARAFVHASGPCAWHSDYWFYAAGVDVLAENVDYTVTPSGHVHARSEYPAVPLICE